MKRFEVEKRGNDLITRESLTDYLMRQKDGKYAVEVKLWNGSKTWLQIKTIKGVVIPGISDYTGETRKEVERRLKKDYGVTEHDEIDGEPVLILVSFSQYSKDQMREFLDQVLIHCEHDCGIIFDLETRKKLQIDYEAGGLKEV